MGLAGAAFGQCETTKLHSFDPGTADRFGSAVAAAGNLAVVGAPQTNFNQSGVDGGTQFIYERINGVWTWVFGSEEPGTNQFFGRSVATDGTIVAVGQGGGATVGAFPAGEGSVYKKVNGQWTGIFTPNVAGAAGDDFGFSAAVGNGRIAFGAPQQDFSPGDDMGGVKVFRINASNQTELVTNVIRPANSSQAGEHFGYAVAIAPQGGPNAGMLVVGAPDRDNGQTTSTGGIYVFNHVGNGYTLQNLPSQWDEAFQFNGLAVATNGSWIAAGAPSFGNARGRVFVYEKLQNGNWEVSGFISGPDGDGGNFGSSISMSGDTMVVGAPGLDRAYVFRDSGDGWALIRTITAASVNGTASFAAGVATNGIDVLVGDPGDTFNNFAGAGTVAVKSLAMMTGSDTPGAAEFIGLPASLVGCLEGATPVEGGLPGMCGSSANSPDVYYTMTARRAGVVVADTIGSDFDTVLSAHDHEPTFQDANLMICNDDINGAANRQSRITFPVQLNQQIWIRVAGYDGAVGGFHLNVRYECAADFNDDGFVDFFDYDDFVQCYEGGACPPGKAADINGDQFVDFFDYDAFVQVFETGC
jgi:hypothetical protein